MWGKGNPYTLLVEMSTSTTTMEKCMEAPPKTKINLPHGPEISLLWTCLKKCKPIYNKDTCTTMFIETLLECYSQ
jgi:hypothetical protein